MLQIRYIDIVGMFADPVSGSYQILVTGTPLPATDESLTELYDSRAGRWFHHCRSCQDFLQVFCEEHAFWLDGSFYCLTNPLISYDLEKRDWVDLNVKMPPGDIRCLSLMVCQGKLFLAAKIMEINTVRSVCIWMLSNESGGELSWVKIEEMPDEILRKMDSPRCILIQCQGHGDLICFSSTRRGWQSIIYNLSERTLGWDAAVDMPYEPSFPVGMPYEPSLSARV